MDRKHGVGGHRNGIPLQIPITNVPYICIMLNLQSVLISPISKMWEYGRAIKSMALESNMDLYPSYAIYLQVG